MHIHHEQVSHDIKIQWAQQAQSLHSPRDSEPDTSHTSKTVRVQVHAENDDDGGDYQSRMEAAAGKQKML